MWAENFFAWGGGKQKNLPAQKIRAKNKNDESGLKKER